MSIWVKICGNTSLEDALLASEAGADAVGFVFAASPRQVTAQVVGEIVPGLPDALEKIGVFVNSTPQEVESIVRGCGLTGVQLHSETSAEMHRQLRERVGDAVRILRVVHFDPDALRQSEALTQDSNIDALLVDSRTANGTGGTGVAYDWSAAAEGVFREPRLKKIVAAGGLTPENVGRAIATLRPWGVDVVSGVELAPRRKDPEKVRSFVARARAT